MTDVSGIPNLGFGGGPIFAGGYSPNINYTAENNANLAYVNAANQASLNANNLYGPGGFGAATDAYSAAGAAYGRATGGVNWGRLYGPQPGPSYGGYGGAQEPYADRSTLNDAEQQYYDAHEARYGYAPPASFFTGTGPLSWATMYGGGPAAATPGAPFQTATGNVGQSPGMSTGMGGFNNQPGDAVRSELTDAQQQYYDGHVARYGYAPPASFFASSNNGPLSWNVMYGGGGGGGGAPLPPPGVPAQPFSPSGPTASQTTYADRGSLTLAQQQYYDGHVARYGYPPPADFFTRSGPLSWATMYGGAGGSGAPMADAPPSSPGGLIPGGGGGGGAGYNPAFGTVGGGGGGFEPGYDSLSDVQKQYYQAHIDRYGSAPPMSFFTGTGPLSWNTMYGGGGQSAPFQTATGNVGQSPGLATGYGGFNNQPGDAVRSDLTPVQQGYYDAHVARYGYAPPSSFFASSNNGPLSWNQMYGGGAGGTALGGIGAGTNVGDFQQEAINQGQQSMLTLQDQIGAALNPTPPSDTLTDADRAAGTVPTSGPGSGIDAINTAAGIDPNTGQQYGVPAAGPGGALPFTGYNPQGPDFYRSPEQSYTQFQTQNPMVWQQAVPNNDPDIMNAIYAAAGNMGVSPAALAALFAQESNFNPRESTSGNNGVPQMSAAQWSDAPFNGTIGGLTYDQYQGGTAAQQIAAYADWMVRSGNLTKSGMAGVGDQSPEMQAAILQAINLAPNAPGWRTALVGGNMSTQTGPPQGGRFNDTSIGAMEDVFRERMAGWR